MVSLTQRLSLILLSLAIVVIGLLFGLGRLHPSDVGLYRQQLVPALLGGIVFWACLQLVALITALFSGSVSINPLWHNEGGTAVAGGLIEELLGNALVEEIVFRGFLFVQLLLLFNRAVHRRFSFVVALVISQVIFALSHVPNFVWVYDRTLFDALASTDLIFVSGLLLALVYWRTRNLLLVVVIHMLRDEPTAIIAAPSAVFVYTTLLLVVSIILFWPRAWAKPQPVNT